MTKEQTIKHLKLMQSGARNAIRFKKNDKEISEEERKEDIEIYQDQLEALDMAIKALEQQSSEDCVSRKAMLDAITEIDGNINMDIYTNEVREIVKELPPVTPTRNVGKWIKTGGSFRCSECMVMPEFKDIRTLKYCPNCGVAIRGTENG